MTLAPAFLDEIRARVSLSTVVARRVKLNRAGREMKGCCPFHNEKTPSFYVNDDKAFYHCFGCGEHGSAIDWMMKQEGLGFIDAVKSLAGEAGMEMPEEDEGSRERAQAAAGLHDVTAAAATWFGEQLGGIGGAAAREYLERRGIAADMSRAFGLGFAPDTRSKLKAALAAMGNDKLVETGLLIAPEEGGEPYDRFRGRLMFPIRDPRGRVIGFGGRILGVGQPKYLNSPDTPLFDKGRTLYNLDRAAPPARKSQRLIVVEGYMDVIGLAQAGIVEAVAPLGTALTEAQLGLMWRVVPEPILCFDGDAAGQRAALRAALRALPLLEPGKSLRFATLPPGKDPDDVVREGGAAAFEALLAVAEPLHNVIWEKTLAESGSETPEQRAAIQVKLRELAKSIGDQDVRVLYDQIYRDLFWRHFGRPKDRQTVLTVVSPHSAELRELKLLDSEMLALLVGVMNYPHVAGELFERVSQIPHGRPITKNLIQRIIEAIAWAPELNRFGLISWLRTEGFWETATRVRTANKLHLSFTTMRRRVLHAEDDLRVFINAVANYYLIHDEWEQACIKSRASHRDGCNATLMNELEATKVVLRERRDQHYRALYEYSQVRPIDQFDPKEPDWEWPINDPYDGPANDNADSEMVDDAADVGVAARSG